MGALGFVDGRKTFRPIDLNLDFLHYFAFVRVFLDTKLYQLRLLPACQQVSTIRRELITWDYLGVRQ